MQEEELTDCKLELLVAFAAALPPWCPRCSNMGTQTRTPCDVDHNPLADLPLVLGLAGMELIFPIAALIVLCSVLVARKVLITHQCFGYC